MGHSKSLTFCICTKYPSSALSYSTYILRQKTSSGWPSWAYLSSFAWISWGHLVWIFEGLLISGYWSDCSFLDIMVFPCVSCLIQRYHLKSGSSSYSSLDNPGSGLLLPAYTGSLRTNYLNVLCLASPELASPPTWISWVWPPLRIRSTRGGPLDPEPMLGSRPLDLARLQYLIHETVCKEASSECRRYWAPAWAGGRIDRCRRVQHDDTCARSWCSAGDQNRRRAFCTQRRHRSIALYLRSLT